MGKNKKYALLDTDFLYKSHLARNEAGHTLAEHSKQVYVFCSDDFKARQSIASLTKPINCISILGVFYKLMKMGHDKTEMQEYYDRLSAFLKNQTEL